MLTTQEEKFVSIFIKPTIDLTLTLEPAEKGVVCAIGKLHMGNPYYPVILGNNPEPLLSTISNRGGNPDWELGYHIQDFFNSFNGKMIIGRVMNADDKTKILKQTKDGNGDVILDDSTDINVFGVDNIKNWDDKDPDAAVEAVITTCPLDTKVTVEMVNKDDILTITLYDRYGNTIYSKTGSCYYDALDDNGKNYYIGNIIDKKVINVKTDTNNSDYESNFTLIKTYDNGIVTESGDKNYSQALKVIKTMAEKCDYAIAGGLSDKTTLQDFRSITYQAKLPLVIDLKDDTVDDAISTKNNLNLNVSDCCFIWNRGKDVFEVGNQKIGLSGWYVGQAVKRNLSKLVDDVEYRVEGIAGVDYQVPRKKEDELEILSDDDLTKLVDNRINTVRMFDDKLVLADVLSAEPKNVATRLFPVVEGNLFVNRYIARILQAKLFKNLNEAKQFAQVQTKKLFDKCQRNGYFNNDVDEKYKIEITDKDNDTVIVNYWYVPAGVMRRGIVQGTLTQKITN